MVVTHRVPSSARPTSSSGTTSGRRGRGRTAGRRSRPARVPGRPTSSSVLDGGQGTRRPRPTTRSGTGGDRHDQAPRPASPSGPAARGAPSRRRRSMRSTSSVEPAGAGDELRASLIAAPLDPRVPRAAERCRPRSSVAGAVGEAGVREQRPGARPAPAGRPPTWGGSGRPRGRTAGRRCGARPGRSRRRGPSAAPRFGGSATSRRATRPPGRTTRASSAKNAVELDEVAQGEAARDAVDRARRAPAGAGCRPAPGVRRCGRRPACRTTGRRRSARQAVGGQLAAEVAGAAGQVEHDRPRARAAAAHRPPPPADVHAERHDPVDEVVARRDGVEHRPDRLHLVVALGQVLRVDRQRRRLGGGHGPSLRAS